ncbi:MAG: DUF4231 domain-containing protein [Myxococcales bacterium]|nr:DUF4231 domain-containing protein [Myxococcales bacterium]
MSGAGPESIEVGGRQLRLLRRREGLSAQELLVRLGYEGVESVLVVCGGARGLDRQLSESPELGRKLRRLLAEGVVPAAQVCGSMVLTGGTDAGIMALTGQAFAAVRGDARAASGNPLVGVVAEGAIEAEPEDARPGYEPNHDALVFSGAAKWGDECQTLFELAAAASKHYGRTPTLARAAVTLVVNGGEHTRPEVDEALGRGWPLVVIAGSGGYADELAAAGDTPRGVVVVGLDEDPRVLRRALAARLELDPRERLLVRAWQAFVRYDQAAIDIFARWRRFEWVISVVGLIAVASAVLSQVLESLLPGGLSTALNFVVVLLPIALSTMIAARNRFELGLKAVFLRSAAEAIKREIYGFRTKTGPYRRRRRARLAQRLRQINEHVMATIASEARLPADAPKLTMWLDAGDDGFSDLEGDQYIEARIAGQIGYFSSKVTQLERRVRRLNWAIYISGGVGTLLATEPGWALWIAVTTAFAAAMSARLQR